MIYLDNHATTPCDVRVAEAMMPWLVEKFGNPHSSSHEYGRQAKAAIDSSLELIASKLRVGANAVLITSGATESNNLAIDGVCRHPRQKRRHVVTTTVEHPSVLDVVARLERDGFRVTRVPVHPVGHQRVGEIQLDALASAIDEDTAIVSVHWANNEIGVLQPIRQIADLAHASGALFHSDATQAVGRVDVDLETSDVDLVSASAHKFYGPKCVGLLTIGGGQTRRRIRLKPMIIGGGQQHNLRSGTLSPANVVGLATALDWTTQEIETTNTQVNACRSSLWQGLQQGIEGIRLNGPDWNGPDRIGPQLNGSLIGSASRLAGNLNCMLPGIEGEAWMAACPQVAFSSGSACSSVDAKPSHVLMGIGLSESDARCSVRFGVGKFNTPGQIDDAVKYLVAAYRKLAATFG